MSEPITRLAIKMSQQAHSRLIQERLFNQNYLWQSSPHREPRFLHKKYLVIYSDEMFIYYTDTLITPDTAQIINATEILASDPEIPILTYLDSTEQVVKRLLFKQKA